MRNVRPGETDRPTACIHARAISPAILRGGVEVDVVHPCSFLLLEFFAVFFVAAEAVDLLEVLTITLLMVLLLSLLSALLVVVVKFASSSLVSSRLLSGDSKREGWGVRIISNNKVIKIRFLIPLSFLRAPLTSSCSRA